MTGTQQASHPAPAADPVTAALGGLGAPVAGADGSALPLGGPSALWLVTEGSLDLFAVAAAEDGHWHYLGRLEAGTLLLGAVEGPRHTLVGRLTSHCAVRRLPLRELYAPQGAEGYEGYPGYEPVAGPLEHAVGLGLGRGLAVLFAAPQADGPAAGSGPADEDVLWVDVPPGSVRRGAEFAAEAAADLLVGGALWQSLVDQQYRLLTAVDGWVERLERAHEDRAAAGIRAGEAVRERADQALLDSIGRRDRSPRARGEAGDDAVYAVFRQVARASGIALPEAAARSVAGRGRLDPVERMAAAARLRTRPVRLAGEWWRTDAGPLVGRRAKSGAPVALLWRRGRYEALNPATGARIRIGAKEAAEFEERATMLYRPLPERPLTLRRLMLFSLRGSRGDLRNLVLSGLVTVALGALVPVATGQVLGAYVPSAQTGLIAQMCVAVMVAGVVSAAFMLLQSLTLLRLEGRIEAALQPAVWDRLLRLPTAFFADRSTGELASAAMGISAIRRVLSGIGPTAVQSVTVAGVNLVLLLVHSVPMALAAIGVLLVVSVVFLLLGLWQVKWQRKLVELGNRLNNQAFQTLRGLPKLRVAAAESFAYAAWARGFARSRRMQQRAGRIRNLSTVLSAVYLPLCSLLMFMLLAGPARGTLSAAEFLTFNTAVTMMLTSVTQLTGALVSAVAVLPLYEQVRPVLDAEPEVRASASAPGELTGELAARGLSFRYAEDGPLVLDDVSLSVRPGEFVAVVGPSGSGKSTLLRLLIGFDRPQAGTVLYDGQDLAALDQAAVRRQLGVVLQNAQPLTGTVLDCVCGAEVFTQEEAWAAAEAAGLAEDIRRMPMGLHTMIAQGGAVSGGQRQRLMIAQALIRRPRLLFLDEATSALDNGTQRTVMESTRALAATRIVVAHRLSTVMDADRVLVMDGGRIVEEGSPAALLALPDGRLRALVRRQLA
ncbi:NHLP bacteriocin export ABC transporter permease/ATPase subunit [Streptomyces sp. CHA1]|uniref:NHLP bacteriocin export ABC transporter permease/ATPase subunit n=1 Tax=unclassified Streptomyces TaxID=2593676 RepID=UPI001BFC56E0|nr:MULTISPECIES: NHLP bacteriocin export ABC transporter permease/ATPase subunit [unclassified Streptomyces]MBT3155997.1 NHLP bacteriocin export ABC transporter permease/ATPase subunit [Streptomyces sp. G11C]MCO6699569.1 NHLP bacteriocin export ABC transporter permease/ATPase subunit [Streptomyces sp. CHB9.2]MCO6705714.1 NHLP bacteriocin export ABC transporter permease/ATPase subunit [Streptomyces sp. CHA3]MCO6711711.1 NHLP bacteriocin export ABC transporter permease/ATPase subunit [Streptomyce